MKVTLKNYLLISFPLGKLNGSEKQSIQLKPSCLN